MSKLEKLKALGSGAWDCCGAFLLLILLLLLLLWLARDLDVLLVLAREPRDREGSGDGKCIVAGWLMVTGAEGLAVAATAAVLADLEDATEADAEVLDVYVDG